jgi:hypothetical protein
MSEVFRHWICGGWEFVPLDTISMELTAIGFGERGGEEWHFASSVALGGFWLARGFVLYDCACTFRGTDPRS